MEREAFGDGIGRPDDRRRLLDQTADAIGPLPGGALLVEPDRRPGLAVGIAQERAERCGTDEVAQRDGADYAFSRHGMSPDTRKPDAMAGLLVRGSGKTGGGWTGGVGGERGARVMG